MPENPDADPPQATATPPKRRPGRPRKLDRAEAGQRQRDRAAANQKASTRAAQDIADGFTTAKINWERRLACKRDLKRFGYEYLPNVFYLGIGRDHLKIISKAERCCIETAKFALAMPRGNGKTAWCRATKIWATAYAYKLFPFFIGSNEDQAKKTLSFIKKYWSSSQALREDFPEIAYPIHRLNNSHHLAKGQLFLGNPTHIEWGSDSIRYPALQLPPEIAEPYLQNDPDSLLRNRDGTHFRVGENYVPASAGILIRAAGIDGSIRGEADIHPVTLSQPRPDIVLADDIQKDAKANSPSECERLINLLDGAIGGLSGPDVPLAVLMPCTVTREGDVSDTYLDHERKPEYLGERCSMVEKWPAGIDDYSIDPESISGKHWLKYDELRRKSFQRFEDIRMASAYYLKHREEMDAGFVLAWPDRYNGAERYGHNREYSGIQHAMNRRFQSPATFPAEFQNRPRSQAKVETVITPQQLAERTVEIPRGVIPGYAQHLVAMVDVQNEAMYYLVLAVDNEFSGMIVDYGTYPEVGMPYYQKRQFDAWSLLTRRFFEAYPEQRSKTNATAGGAIRAPFEAKIYFGLAEVTKLLKSKNYAREDIRGSTMQISKIGYDARWGKASDAIRRYIQNQRDPSLMALFGSGVTPSHKQYEEYTLTRGWLFEHQKHPGLQECKWIWRPGPDGYYYLSTDVNRLKTFAMSRLSSPLGMPGAIALHSGTAEEHRLVSEHIAGSEWPDVRTARGRSKEMWELREGGPDNEYLDCLVGCLALASFEGARVRETDEQPVAVSGRRRSLSQLYAEKRGAF